MCCNNLFFKNFVFPETTSIFIELPKFLRFYYKLHILNVILYIFFDIVDSETVVCDFQNSVSFNFFFQSFFYEPVKTIFSKIIVKPCFSIKQLLIIWFFNVVSYSNGSTY